MALKADRNELDVDISYFYNAGTAERGGVVSHTGTTVGGSGAAMDQAAALVSYKQGAAGVIPVGVLLNDVVNLDLTRQHINWHKDEVQKGGKVSVLKKGYVVTNSVTGTPNTVGEPACLDDGGATGNFEPCDGSSTDVHVGRFMSLADEDGYYKVEVNLPAPTVGVDT
tara:strand:+ start:14119 stop:14622 length:504 start_codon:yes stop_codon:yes gene_type:complete